MVSLGIIIILLALILLIPKFSLFEYFCEWMKCDVVRNATFSYLDNIYTSETSSFIKLILFNVKSEEIIEFYKQMVDLSIVWLICSGGFHISFLSRLFYKMFKKFWKVGKWIDFSLLLIYSYLLKFSYSSLRVVLVLVLNPILQKFDIQSYNKIGLIGIIFGLLNPSCFISYSFLLSFIGVCSAYFVNSLDIDNKLISSILISVLGFGSMIPFVINMNHKISLLTFVNSFVFSYVFIFLFMYFLIFSWMPFMAIVHHGIIIGCYCVIGNVSYFNIYIWTKTWQTYIIFAYYSFLYALYRVIYHFVWHNKV